MKLTTCLIVMVFFFGSIHAQSKKVETIDIQKIKFEKNEFTPKKRLFTKRILPVTLIAAGVLLSKNDFEKSLQKDLRGSVGKDFYSKIDDYTRYAPVIQLYTADILGVKSKNHWFDQTKNLMLSTLITGATTAFIKKEVHKSRPGDSEQTNSFPSGHTSIAFATATVLYEEFIDSSPLLAYSGYLFAATTGSLRMLNNKHYLSDVLVGAGIGILSTRLVYHLDHLIQWNPFKKMDGVAFAPQYLEGGLGFYFAKSF
ncbi:phosphatase PAP2 family protein [Aquimarina sp. 2201CG5-10]|uniref:phosphatase PAP2 family protein n=1 Tax=Aquimarina callyspongiae TaxID=3098150 RepID=UPI002AB42446|nr:phosphatase PAP2 family protein [Aquimarina sp. 2201CG5-10]MDY8137775.1 phosphatase PAP2 family protein [Aquimarina sp. 2201CG5-10]